MLFRVCLQNSNRKYHCLSMTCLYHCGRQRPRFVLSTTVVAAPKFCAYNQAFPSSSIIVAQWTISALSGNARCLRLCENIVFYIIILIELTLVGVQVRRANVGVCVTTAATAPIGSGTLLKPKHPALQPKWQFRTEPLRYEKRDYRRRGRMEIMFDRLEDWCRVATSVGCCPNVFFSAVGLDATVIF